MNKNIIFEDLGLRDYKSAWDYQEKLFGEIIAQKVRNRNLSENVKQPTSNYLLFTEHPHVYTIGKSGKEKHLLIGDAELQRRNATFHKINRGGDITYHGPGQLVGYPILDLDNFFTDIGRYLRLLEETIIVTIGEYGIAGGRLKGETGVWIDADKGLRARKICAMGVRCSRWVTMHGWGFNVNTDLSYFGNIIPCGINDKAVTSLEKELGAPVQMEEIKEKLRTNFCRLFGANITQRSQATVTS